jgi:hypothetical protein
MIFIFTLISLLPISTTNAYPIAIFKAALLSLVPLAASFHPINTISRPRFTDPVTKLMVFSEEREHISTGRSRTRINTCLSW